jgi:hypothetical protein
LNPLLLIPISAAKKDENGLYLPPKRLPTLHKGTLQLIRVILDIGGTVVFAIHEREVEAMNYLSEWQSTLPEYRHSIYGNIGRIRYELAKYAGAINHEVVIRDHFTTDDDISSFCWGRNSATRGDYLKDEQLKTVIIQMMKHPIAMLPSFHRNTRLGPLFFYGKGLRIPYDGKSGNRDDVHIVKTFGNSIFRPQHIYVEHVCCGLHLTEKEMEMKKTQIAFISRINDLADAVRVGKEAQIELDKIWAELDKTRMIVNRPAQLQPAETTPVLTRVSNAKLGITKQLRSYIQDKVGQEINPDAVAKILGFSSRQLISAFQYETKLGKLLHVSRSTYRILAPASAVLAPASMEPALLGPDREV